MDQKKFTIRIIAATYWEVRGLIQKLQMSKTEQGQYECLLPAISVTVQISGIGHHRARQAAERICSTAPSLIISTGFCGAIKKGIKAGEIILDTEKSHPETISLFVRIGNRKKIKVIQEKFLTVTHPLLEKNEKLKLGEKTDAVAVEMESDSVLNVCKKKKIPFCSVRAVSDTADQNLPSIVTAIDPQGRVGTHFLKTLLSHPSEWSDFFRLAVSSGKAEKNLAEILTQFIKEIQTESEWKKFQ